jgi:hypothetical protein
VGEEREMMALGQLLCRDEEEKKGGGWSGWVALKLRGSGQRHRPGCGGNGSRGPTQRSRANESEGLPCGSAGGGGWGPSGGGRGCCARGPAVNDTGTLTSRPNPKRIKFFDFFVK